MSFADNLRKVRKERNISQEDLAESLNVSRQAVSKWEQGIGYPEMEKMIMLAKELNISLDYLISGESEDLKQQKQEGFSTGKIMIRTHDDKKIVSCYKVLSASLSTPVFKSKTDEPKYALFGVDGSSLLGENKTLLGWYADKDGIQNEMNAISAALKNGDTFYELRYAAKVKSGFFSIKLYK